jgi:hypothetical protein
VVEFVHAMKFEKPILMGHSMGGATVMRVGAEYPDLAKAIIMLDPAGFGGMGGGQGSGGGRGPGAAGSEPAARPAAPIDPLATPMIGSPEVLVRTNNYHYDDLVAKAHRQNPKWDIVDCQYWALSKKQYHGPYTASTRTSTSLRRRPTSGRVGAAACISSHSWRSAIKGANRLYGGSGLGRLKGFSTGIVQTVSPYGSRFVTNHSDLGSKLMDTKAYFFAGNSYVCYDMQADAVIPGYPKPIAGNWPIPFTSSIDTVLRIDAETIYFVQGPQCVRYNSITRQAGALQPLAAVWPGLPFTDRIDVALRWDANTVYFFKDDLYVKFDLNANAVLPNYPQKISASWRGAAFSAGAGFSAGINTAIRWNNDKVYFFKGIYYLRYDIASDQMDPGYPQLILSSWPTLTGFDILEMKGAFVTTPDPVLGVSQFVEQPALTGLNDFGGAGVYGESTWNFGVFGVSGSSEGVHGQTNSAVTAAISAIHLNANGTGAALFAQKAGTVGHAGYFQGNVQVNGNLGITGQLNFGNADCAEDFNLVADAVAEPGTVMVLGDNEAVEPCARAYDKRVAGVVSGAGKYRPGILLDQQDTGRNRAPIGLVGKVYCKVDADYGAIEIGDLLTTSTTPGHAMKVLRPQEAFGSVIGKALSPLPAGRNLIPILIALQ